MANSFSCQYGTERQPPYMRCGLLAVCRDADLDLLRFRLLTLRHMQCQDPIAILGANVLGVDRVRQGEAPRERAIRTFNSEVIVLVDVLLELPLSTDGQRIVFDANVNVLLLKIRQVGLYHQFVLGFVYVHWWRPGCQVGMTRAFASSVVLKQTNDLFLQRCQNAGLVPTCNGVHGNLLGCLGQGQFQITHFGLDYRMAESTS